MCEYWEVKVNGRMITRGNHDHAVMVLTQLKAEGITASLIKVYPTCEEMNRP